MAADDPAGDEDEAGLIARFEARVRTVARRRVHPDWVDDIVNEVLGAVIEAVRDGRVRSPESLPGYVYGVTRNVISNWARSEARARSVATHASAPVAETATPLQLLLDGERRNAVVGCLRTLRRADRRLLYLSFYRGLTPGEVAEELEIAPNVARQRLWRARERFKEKWRGRHAL